MPLHPDLIGDPLPGESFDDYNQRVQTGVTTAQAAQTAADAQADAQSQAQSDQVATAAAYKSQGVAAYTDSTGALKAVTAVPGGPPLTGNGSNGGIVYGQDGTAQRVTFPSLDAPKLVDPYTPEGGASPQTDDAGNTYLNSPGMPTKWTGVDPVAAAQSAQDAADAQAKQQAQDLDRAAAVNGQMVSQFKGRLTDHQKALKANAAALQAIPELSDFDPDDENAAAALPKQFAPTGDDYNQTAGWFSGGALTTAAQNARDALAQRQQQAQALLTQRQTTQTVMANTQALHDAAQRRLDAVNAQREALASQRLGALGLPTGEDGADPSESASQPPDQVPGLPAASASAQPQAPQDSGAQNGALPASSPAPEASQAESSSSDDDESDDVKAQGIPGLAPVASNPAATQPPAPNPAKAQPPTTFADQLTGLGAGAVKGLTEGLGQIIRSPIGQGVIGIGDLLDGRLISDAINGKFDPNVNQKQADVVGNVVSHLTDGTIPDNVKNTVGMQAGGFIGNIAPIIAASVLPGAQVSVPTLLFGQGFQSQYEDAKAKLTQAAQQTGIPADPEHVEDSAKLAGVLGGAINTILGLPLGAAGNALSKVFGGVERNTISAGMTSAFENGGIPGLFQKFAQVVSGGVTPEVAAELNAAKAAINKTVGQRFVEVGKTALRDSAIGAGAQVAQNVVAQNVYDPDRSLFDGVPQQALSFGALGAAHGALRQAALAQEAAQLRSLGSDRGNAASSSGPTPLPQGPGGADAADLAKPVAGRVVPAEPPAPESPASATPPENPPAPTQGGDEIPGLGPQGDGTPTQDLVAQRDGKLAAIQKGNLPPSVVATLQSDVANLNAQIQAVPASITPPASTSEPDLSDAQTPPAADATQGVAQEARAPLSDGTDGPDLERVSSPDPTLVAPESQPLAPLSKGDPVTYQGKPAMVAVIDPAKPFALLKVAPDPGSNLPAQVIRAPVADLQRPPPLAPATYGGMVGDKLDSKHTAFAPDSGTLGIPRDQMPQVAAEHRGAMANFLNARGMKVSEADVLPGSLKPSQAEFNPGKVAKAGAIREAGDASPRRILVSNDGHVIDGHHQWLDRLKNTPDQTVPALKIDAPARDILSQIHEFPSAGMEKAPDIDTATTHENTTQEETLARPGSTADTAPAGKQSATASPALRAPGGGDAGLAGPGRRDGEPPAAGSAGLAKQTPGGQPPAAVPQEEGGATVARPINPVAIPDPSHAQPTTETPAVREGDAEGTSADETGGGQKPVATRSDAGQAPTRPRNALDAGKPRTFDAGSARDSLAVIRPRLEPLLAQHGLTIAESPGDAAHSGFEITPGNPMLRFVPEGAADSMRIVHDQGGDPEAWLESAARQEIIHHEDALASEGNFDHLHAAMWQALPAATRAEAQRLYGRPLNPAEGGAEYIRMARERQQQRGGAGTGLTEAHHADTSAMEAILDARQPDFVDRHLAKMARVAAPVPVRRTFQMPHAPTGIADTLDHIVEQGGIVSPSQAKLRPTYSKYAGDYDGAPTMGGFYHHAVYGGKMMPDRMAQALHENYGVGDGSVDGMWNAITQAKDLRTRVRAEQQSHAALEKQANRFDKDALTAATAKGKKEVNTSNLAVGDKLTVGDQTLKVTDVDPDTLDVTLEDHSKYGVQKVADGQALYVEKLRRAPQAKAGNDFAPGDEENNNSPAPVTDSGLPTLRRNENQGDLLSKQSEDLTLVGEKGVDHGARQAARELAERESAEAKAKQDLAQTPLFAAKPSALDNYRLATPEERKAFGIPPAWTGVLVSTDPNARRIAVGKDAKGRTQSRYSVAHTSQAQADKFARVQAFNAALPGIMARVENSLAGGEGKEEAAVLRLIRYSAFRNGGDEDTGGKVKAYGASNLRAEHVAFDGDTTHFDFTGKLGVQQQHAITHPELTADLRQRAASGGALFNTNDAKVRAYLQKSGDFKVHDFRTWNATDLARQEALSAPAPKTPEDFWNERDRIGDLVAKKLGDTRKIVLESYIDPTVFEPWKSSLAITDETRPKRQSKAALAAATKGNTTPVGEGPGGADEQLLRDQLVPAGRAADDSPAGSAGRLGAAKPGATEEDAGETPAPGKIAQMLQSLRENVTGPDSALGSAVDDIKKVFAPAARGPDAKLTAEAYQQVAAEMDRRKQVWGAALGGLRRLIAAQPEARQKEILFALDDKTPLGDPGLDKALAEFRSVDNDRIAYLRDFMEQKGITHWKNWENLTRTEIPHIFADPEKAQAAQVAYEKRFESNHSFMKRRGKLTYRELVQDLGLEPKSWNAADLIAARYEAQDRYVGAQQLADEMVQAGTAHFETGDYEPKAGEVEIGHRILNRTQEVDGKARKMKLYAQEPAARIVENALSQGLQGKAWYRGYRALGNRMTSAQQGLSAFHGGFITMEGITNEVALGIDHLVHGEIGKGLAAIARAPIAPILNYKLGRQIVGEIRKPGSESEAVANMVDAIVSGGGRAGLDNVYHENDTQKFLDALSQKKYLSAAWRAPFAGVEQLARPIMEKYVPYLKMAAAHKLIAAKLERNPDLSATEIRSVASDAVASVNNTFGQMTYDNLHLHKTAKDILMGMTRSLGWNWGTFAELGGGVADFFKNGFRAANKAAGGKGPSPEFSAKMAYTLALPLVAGTVGAIINGLFGQTPESLKDYYFPKTGDHDSHGQPLRLSLPTYMKDVFAAADSPTSTITSKLHPLLATLGQMFQNRDYYGTKIRNEDDPILRQILSEAEYAGKQFTPFTVTNALQTSKDGASLPVKALGVVGFGKAPARINQSDAEKLAIQFQQERAPQGSRTREQADHARLKSQIVNSLRKKDAAPLRAAFAAHQITMREVHELRARAALTPLQSLVHSLSLPEAQKVFSVATPPEKAELMPLIAPKTANARKLAV